MLYKSELTVQAQTKKFLRSSYSDPDGYVLKFNYLLCRNTVFRFLHVLKTLACTVFHLQMKQNCFSLSLKRPGLLPDVYGKYENDWSSVQILVLLSCRSWRLKARVRFKSASLLTSENQICMNFRESILLNSKRKCLELPSLIQTGNVFNSVLSNPLWLHAAFLSLTSHVLVCVDNPCIHS